MLVLVAQPLRGEVMLQFPCPDQSTLTCMITYKSLYEIPRPYCLEDKVIAMTSLFSYLGRHCMTSLFSYVYKPVCLVG
jgi:hypothetical protein